MNPSQKASPAVGLELELPVLTDVVDDAALPVLTEEPAFELPDFDFSSELDEMAATLPADVGAMELEIPAELPLEAVLDIGPAPAVVESGVDFSKLPSLDLDVASLDELALNDVLPGLEREAPPLSAGELSTGTELDDESFDFLLTPAGSDADGVASVPSAPMLSPDDELTIPELTVEWSESPVADGMDETGAALPVIEQPVPSVESSNAGPIPVLTPEDRVTAEAVVRGHEPLASGVPLLEAELAGEYGLAVAAASSAMPEAESVVTVAPFSAQTEIADAADRDARDAALPVPAEALQHIDINSLPTGVLGGGVGPEPEAGGAVDEFPWAATECASRVADAPTDVAAVLPEMAMGALLPESGAVADAFESVDDETSPDEDAYGDQSEATAADLLTSSPVSETPAVGAAEAEVLPQAGSKSCAVVDEQALIDSLTQKILPRMKVELSLWLQDALEMQARQMLSGVMHQLKEDYEMLFNETLRESLRQAITEIGRDEREGKS